MEPINDEYYMRLAVELASKASGQTGINPVVGCVIVKDGRIVGVGSHLKRGTGHAEVHALNMAGEEAEGSTVYVTLEPCSHYGKTPPCADRIAAARAARVVVAATDPNPQVSGRGIAKLRAHGIEVTSGVLEAESRKLNEAFEKYITTGLPFVTLKTASTLDGRIASKTGNSRWVTGEAARAAVHALRHTHQAIMVGAGTVLADDPSLTTRLPVPGIDPVRIVTDAKLRLPLTARLLSDGLAPTIVLTTESADPERIQALEAAGVQVLACGSGERIDLKLAMRRLGEREISSVLLEGGGRLNGAMLEAGLIDKAVLFYAAKIIGGPEAPGLFDFGGFARMADAVRLDRVTVETYGEDICIAGYPVYGG
ncbi:MAG TPA: bifunctional diaminohydroxyphosphoribosylaminopyrimidine deaminase/5-amino-6-(5-phosphoribosylamino)uracil reductase RibD [Paenibacillus sp.]|uniref:bifunctional diaminohydroxyphosphoribosylaminopyrimidine deaminase/5-amino-6-(5-phosphoribosylamino)uracil reductase RibD n=1 Tax=Paenibacillus sp. TaxID=58172 RepID=UPI002B99BE7B|nr:bifunctional diaminohydroxyphosphoribosylaminopyrimidine deaminase/5-amino-6-(5-phosphoribosylamino)uracil reductase RibD [Paenibacillus sp.]HUC92395.1 bifunctional diaminohydroxyphosphoribosylaminopyrimidine deaminase/5-amino-6-(5-phosphoribosylamino)uracil reductase RibD [Paenibacillus sp.]